MEKEQTRFDDYEFKQVMKYAPFQVEDIEEIIACISGEADGPEWHYVCKLKNGSYGYVHAGCDYTGWGCGESGEGTTGTLEEVLSTIKDDYYYKNIRQTLQDQAEGKAPYGLVTGQ